MYVKNNVSFFFFSGIKTGLKLVTSAHMSVLVQFVVCQFDFLEGDHLLHELLSGERGVRVDVQPAGGREEEEERRVISSALIG